MTIFEKIVAGEIPSYPIWEDERHFAFLDIQPLSHGHTLVIPKKNLGSYIFDLSDKEYQSLMMASKSVALLLKQKLQIDRVFVIVEGLLVPHVHVHLIPAQNTDSLSSMQKLSLGEETFKAIQKQITG